jgi:hypothetical protein
LSATNTTNFSTIREIINQSYTKEIDALTRRRDELAKVLIIDAFKELFEREPNLQSVYVTDQNTWNDEFYTLYGTGGEGWDWFAVNGHDYGDIHTDKRVDKDPNATRAWDRYDYVTVATEGHEEDFRLHGVVRDFLGGEYGPNIAEQIFGHYRQFNVTRKGDTLEVEVINIDR